jgi:RNA polymerase sigma-70 factor (ECF subfamily)
VQSADTLQNCSDEDLLARFRSGQRPAFEVLMRRYERELYGYLCRYLGDVNLADDVFQTTFLQVYNKIASYEPGRAARPWLYTIAVNQAIDAMRRQGRHQALSLNQLQEDLPGSTAADRIKQLESRNAGPLEVAELEEQRKAVRAAVSSLPEFLQQVVILGYYQGLKYQEIADILAIPLGTVKSRLNAALHKLHDICNTMPAFLDEPKQELP